MRGQRRNAHRFMLTSSSQHDAARRLPGSRSRRPSSIRPATVANDGLDARTVTGAAIRCLPSTAPRPWPRRPARVLRAEVRRGAQEAHSGGKGARARRALAPRPRCRLKPTARRAAPRTGTMSPKPHSTTQAPTG
jgi:hypothetical protein